MGQWPEFVVFLRNSLDGSGLRIRNSFFLWESQIPTAVFAAVHWLFREPLNRKLWWKFCILWKIPVDFSSLGLDHPNLKELFLKLSHFEFLSFVFYSFCFVSTQAQSPKTFFFFCFWSQRFLFFHHFSLNLEILMPKLVAIFSLILDHLGLQHQIIDFF